MSDVPGIPPRVIIVSGVAGAGKTTVGRALAERLGWDFLEGDDFHPEANVAHMRSGRPLTEKHRGPWLEALGEVVRERLEEDRPAVLTSSALKEAHRRLLRVEDPRVLLVYLRSDEALVTRRLATRREHFFPPELATSQFAALEEPEAALVLDAGRPVAELVDTVVEALSPQEG